MENVQHKKSVARKKTNMKRVQQEATWKKVQHEKITKKVQHRKKSNPKRAQQRKSAT